MSQHYLPVLKSVYEEAIKSGGLNNGEIAALYPLAEFVKVKLSEIILSSDSLTTAETSLRINELSTLATYVKTTLAEILSPGDVNVRLDKLTQLYYYVEAELNKLMLDTGA